MKQLLSQLSVLCCLLGFNMHSLAAADYEMKDGKLVIETEEMAGKGGDYLETYSGQFEGMAYLANNDYTQATFTVDSDEDFAIKLMGCADADVAASVEVYVDEVLLNTMVWSSPTPVEQVGYCNLKSDKEHTIRIVMVGDYGQSDAYVDKVTILPKNIKIKFTSPIESTKVFADSTFEIKWEASSDSKDFYTLNWVNASGETIVLKDSVLASGSYNFLIPAAYLDAKGHYSLTKKASELIPSDFDGAKHTMTNPMIWADVPDPSLVRVEDTYYMVSTTMHMSPGVPVMASKDLVRWRTIGYAYDRLCNNANMNMDNGMNAYGKGSWASSIRYKDGTFYVLTPSYTTNKTHLYTTKDIVNGPWTEHQLPFYHDPSLLLDDDGKMYVVYGGGDCNIVELKPDGSGEQPGGLKKMLIQNPASIAGSNFYVKCEGSHIEKINGQYYVFFISWPSNSCRSELVYRCSTLAGSYEGKVVLQDQGVAQGSIFDTPNGDWYGVLFQDAGSVGRMPYLIPITWQNGWPVFNNGKVPSTLEMDAPQEEGYGMVSSDDFETETLIKECQWNHNPDDSHWSLSARPGYMRLTSGRTDKEVVNTKNMLSQRSFGPKCAGSTTVDVSGLKDGDYAGLCALQSKYGFVAVKCSGNSKSIVMMEGTKEVASVPINQDVVHFRIMMDFDRRADKAYFFYSTDGIEWKSIGSTLSMNYDLAHFVGYRFGLFIYSNTQAGGHADFDNFKIATNTGQPIYLHQNQGGKDILIANSVDVTVLNKAENVEVIEATANATLIITPNPASSVINIIGSKGLQKVEIFDFSGKFIKAVDTPSFSTGSLENGLYMLRIYDEEGVRMETVIIKR
ncbi:MAG: family 43 glycosylhydrolase [Paludibacteraceae bacterium]|nr:family 43 glycosylhydrolase [Paludibacteraceae bacterium]